MSIDTVGEREGGPPYNSLSIVCNESADVWLSRIRFQSRWTLAHHVVDTPFRWAQIFEFEQVSSPSCFSRSFPTDSIRGELATVLSRHPGDCNRVTWGCMLYFFLSVCLSCIFNIEMQSARCLARFPKSNHQCFWIREKVWLDGQSPSGQRERKMNQQHRT